jgi:hypothetical protein
MFGQELVIPKTLVDYCNTRDRVLEQMARANQIIELCQEELKQLSPYLFPSEFEICGYSDKNFKMHLDRRMWRQAFDYTGFMQLMDRQEKQKFLAELEKQPPEFTIENIRSTFLSVMQEADNLFARGLVNVFLRLSDDHKSNTNEPFKVNHKAVLSGMVQRNWGKDTVMVNYYNWASEQLNDIDRVFKVLDGQKHQPRALETACNAAFSDLAKPNTYSDDYYLIRGYLNGNMHITFKRDDLLEKANKIISDFYNGAALAKDHPTTKRGKP